MADTVTTIAELTAISAGSLADSVKRANIKMPCDDLNEAGANKTRKVTAQDIVAAAVSEIGGSGGGGATQVDNIAALRALATTPAEVFIKGHTTAGDGGQGLFRLLASSGRTAGDIDSSGEDDNGFHIVCTTTGAMYGRDTDVAYPEHFGVVGSVDATAAAAASDQTTKMQRWLKLWGNPASFPGIASVRGLQKWQKPRFEAHARFYRCDGMLTVETPVGSPTWYGGIVPSDLEFYGSTFKLSTANFPSFRVIMPRNAGKPKVHLRYYKQLTGGNKTGWNANTYPQLYRDPAVYRQWASSTEFYTDEEITYTISSVTYLYRVTQGGTTNATAPTTSTSEQTSGGCKFTLLGSITTSDAKWMRDHVCECRDIGVWVDMIDNWHGLEVTGENCAIGILECPRGANNHVVGFASITAKYILGAKWCVVTANHLYDILVANQSERLSLTNVPAYAVVRQSDNTTYDYMFTGAAGTESNPASWTQRTYRGSIGWANDITHDLDLLYGRGNSVIDADRSVYGVVVTSFGGTPGPTGNIYPKIGVEFSGIASNTEMVQILYDCGDEHQATCRNDNAEKGAGHIALRHVSRLESPKYNRTEAIRTGRRLNARSWQDDRNNGLPNYITEAPFMHNNVTEFSVPNLFEDSLFSGSDRIYFKRTGLWAHSSASPAAYADYRTSAANAASRPYFNASDRSFDFNYHMAPGCIVEIPYNHTGAVLLEIVVAYAAQSIPSESFDSTTSSYNLSNRVLISAFNPITGSTPFVSPSPFPVPFADGSAEMFPNTSQANRPWVWNGTDSMLPLTVGFAPWVRKVLVTMCGEHIRGYSLRLYNAIGGSIYPAGKANGRGIPYVNAKPERGIWKSPTRLNYSGPATNIIELNKGAGETEYWATSGTQASLVGVEVPFQWAHNGSGGVFERSADNTSWVQIASGVSVTVPADWQDI